MYTSDSYSDDAIIVGVEHVAAVAVLLIIGYGYSVYKERKRRKEIDRFNAWFLMESPE